MTKDHKDLIARLMRGFPLDQLAGEVMQSLVDRVAELEAFVQAEGDAHYSHREFEKIEAERDSWRDVAKSITTDVKMLYDAAKDFHENWYSETFGDLAYEELEKVLDAIKVSDHNGPE